MKYDYFKSNKLTKDRLIIVSENKYLNEMINSIILVFVVGFLLTFISDIILFYPLQVLGILFVFVGIIKTCVFKKYVSESR